MIVIIDYGMGNTGSIKNMLRKIGVESTISSEIDVIEKAEKLILPGVGAFDHGIQSLQSLNLLSVLKEKVFDKKTPLLGICLGMQLLAAKSAEGVLPGLGWLNADVVRFDFTSNEKKYPVPHMAWNYINPKKESILLNNLNEQSRFYFVHSYHMVCLDKENIVATTSYGYEFVSLVEKENIFGAQFHPEKSHCYGMQLLKNYIELT